MFENYMLGCGCLYICKCIHIYVYFYNIFLYLFIYLYDILVSIFAGFNIYFFPKEKHCVLWELCVYQEKCFFSMCFLETSVFTGEI